MSLRAMMKERVTEKDKSSVGSSRQAHVESCYCFGCTAAARHAGDAEEEEDDNEATKRQKKARLQT
jgi:hypothetical protein